MVLVKLSLSGLEFYLLYNFVIETKKKVKEVWYLNNIADDLTYQKLILEDIVEYYIESIANKK
jgi:hypothetical protein